ncbi:MAG: polyprenyl synthetase family protein [Clostridiales bacterium]|nr:polyprenyl synthetase family protein [Clostridiales bacterium]
MEDHEKAISYLSEGHALLRAHGLYGPAGDDTHTFAIDRALSNLTRQKGATVPAAETAAALQALYEAKRLVTARSSIEGRRIILGDWFMSLAVSLSLPLRCPALTALVSEELCRIGQDANRLSFRSSKKAFCGTIDRFTDALYRKGPECGEATGAETPWPKTTDGEATRDLHDIHVNNILLAAVGTGYYKTAAAEARSALAQMESYFSMLYDSDEANEMDGWIYGAIMSGGKRLRPLLVRLCAGIGAKAIGLASTRPSPLSSSLIGIMAAIELMHSASLVHDDIVDRSPLRRSRATINAEKGDGYAAMCGFRMIADALAFVTDDVPDRIPYVIAAIPVQMCGGELCQFDIENKPELQSEDEYFRRIGCKTAALIEGSCVCGAILGGADEQEVNIISDYGRALGLLFQLRDDLLDYSSAPAQAGQRPDAPGKPVSQDMERGIYSLPLLYARNYLAAKDPGETAKLDAVMRKHIMCPADFKYLNNIAKTTGGLDYTREAIDAQAGAALSALTLLPPGPYTEALALLVMALTETQAHTPAGSLQVAR